MERRSEQTAEKEFDSQPDVGWEDRIIVNPAVRSGKPTIKGTRITVYDVLDYLASGMSHEEILQDFPDLAEEDLRACLSFAAARERRLFAAAE